MNAITDFFNNIRLEHLLLSVGFSILAISVPLFVYVKVLSTDSTSKNKENLNEIIMGLGELETVRRTSTKSDLTVRWNTYWFNVFTLAKLAQYGKTPKEAGRTAILAWAIVTLAVGIITFNPIIGIMVATLVLGALGFYGRRQFLKREEKIGEQITSFLASLKSSLQSGDSNERAIIRVTETMNSPIKDNLDVARKMILASNTFQESLEAMERESTNRDLRFLARCLSVASASGGSIVDQIDKIKDSVDNRRRISYEIKSAQKQANTVIYVASATLPIAFLSTYFLSSVAQQFWFVNPYSWIALIASVFFYGVGVFVTKRLVDKIKNM